MGFKNKKCMSVDIGSKYIKIAVGEYKNDHLKVDKLISEEISDDIWGEGRILDSNRLKNIIYGIIKTNKIKTKNISFTISSSKIVKREIEVPRVHFDDRLNLIKYELEQYLPDDVENYVFQYKIIEDIDVNEELYNRILAVAIPKIIVDEYYQLAIDMKLNPILLDINSNSAIKVLEYNYEAFINKDGTKAGVVVIDLGYSNTNITIVEDGIYRFNRLVDIGLSELNQIIEYNELDIPEDKYTDILELDIPEITEKIASMSIEINRIVDFYLSRDSEKTIDKILLYGGGALFKYISIYLMKDINHKVEVFNVSDNLELKDKNDLKDIVLYINAIGALIY